MKQNLYAFAVTVKVGEYLTKTKPGYVLACDDDDAMGRAWTYVHKQEPGLIVEIETIKIDMNTIMLLLRGMAK